MTVARSRRRGLHVNGRLANKVTNSATITQKVPRTRGGHTTNMRETNNTSYEETGEAERGKDDQKLKKSQTLGRELHNLVVGRSKGSKRKRSGNKNNTE